MCEAKFAAPQYLSAQAHDRSVAFCRVRLHAAYLLA
jgi:hypothetical protein